MNTNILRDLSYGVYLIGSKKDGKTVGCIANSVMQITSNPAKIAISINVENYTNNAIEETNEFVCSILPENIDSNVIGTFGFKSSKDIDKYKEIKYTLKDGYPIVDGAIGYIKCKVVDKLQVDTHTIFIGKVIESAKITDEEPMTYAYYHKVKKGKSPAKAPTYIEEKEEKGKKKYICTVCGYVYEADELPENFTCPICGVDRNMFKEVL